LKITEAKEGMRVFVNLRLNGMHTNNTQGWNDQMKVYLGTQQTIRIVNSSNILFDDRVYFWDPRDVDPVDGITKPITTNGKKVVFDVKELD